MGVGERHLRLGSGDGSDTVEGQAGTDPRALRCRHCHGMVGVTGLAAIVSVTNAEPANDTLAINAFAGDDVLVGSAGSDTPFGRDGDDVLIGGLGQDVLDGGPGNNVLIQD
jgi:Ca2+-binding RTX toxin-like protein